MAATSPLSATAPSAAAVAASSAITYSSRGGGGSSSRSGSSSHLRHVDGMSSAATGWSCRPDTTTRQQPMTPSLGGRDRRQCLTARGSKTGPCMALRHPLQLQLLTPPRRRGTAKLFRVNSARSRLGRRTVKASHLRPSPVSPSSPAFSNAFFSPSSPSSPASSPSLAPCEWQPGKSGVGGAGFSAAAAASAAAAGYSDGSGAGAGGGSGGSKALSGAGEAVATAVRSMMLFLPGLLQGVLSENSNDSESAGKGPAQGSDGGRRGEDATSVAVGGGKAEGTAEAEADVVAAAAEAAPTSSWAVPPKPLPPSPTDSSILKVLPYLWSLAADDKSLRWRILVALVLLIAGKAAGLTGPLLFKHALDSLAKSDTPLPRAAAVAAVTALVLSAASKAVSAVSTELRNIVFTPVGQATGRRVEYHFFSHILNMDTAFHLDRKTGALARIIERGKRSIIMIFRAVVFTFIPTAVELVLVCALLGKHVSPSFAAVVLLTFTAYVAWTVALTKASVSIRKEVNRLDALATGKVVDVLLNHETVIQFNNQRLDLMHYDCMLRGYQQEYIQLEKVAAALNGGQATIISIGLAAVMAMAGVRVAQGLMTVGDLVLVNGLILQLSLPLQFLGFLYRDLRQSLVDMEAMFQMLGTQPTLKDGTRELPPSSIGVGLEVDNITFGYSDTQMVLRGVSFSAAPGESVAIVGPSGSGKSTIVKLLLRLFDPSSGSIRVDGVDVCDLQQASLRQAVAVVPQDTVLFNDSIGYNIAYGRPGAAQQDIERAVRQAKLDETLRRMAEGYDTMVGERGLKLSGGEKQRVAIARAFLKNPRLLICDEATSALDSATEASILKSLKELAAGRTCVFVAHRLSTIKHCDKILVMEAGRVVEQGTHTELLAQCGRYASMWALQDSERAPERIAVDQAFRALSPDLRAPWPLQKKQREERERREQEQQQRQQQQQQQQQQQETELGPVRSTGEGNGAVLHQRQQLSGAPSERDGKTMTVSAATASVVRAAGVAAAAAAAAASVAATSTTAATPSAREGGSDGSVPSDKPRNTSLGSSGPLEMSRLVGVDTTGSAEGSRTAGGNVEVPASMRLSGDAHLESHWQRQQHQRQHEEDRQQHQQQQPPQQQQKQQQLRSGSNVEDIHMSTSPFLSESEYARGAESMVRDGQRVEEFLRGEDDDGPDESDAEEVLKELSRSGD